MARLFAVGRIYRRRRRLLRETVHFRRREYGGVRYSMLYWKARCMNYGRTRLGEERARQSPQCGVVVGIRDGVGLPDSQALRPGPDPSWTGPTHSIKPSCQRRWSGARQKADGKSASIRWANWAWITMKESTRRVGDGGRRTIGCECKRREVEVSGWMVQGGWILIFLLGLGARMRPGTRDKGRENAREGGGAVTVTRPELVSAPWAFL